VEKAEFSHSTHNSEETLLVRRILRTGSCSAVKNLKKTIGDGFQISRCMYCESTSKPHRTVFPIESEHSNLQYV
jgi:hypothetical protein